jgi:hypothetical protein
LNYNTEEDIEEDSELEDILFNDNELEEISLSKKDI